VASFLPSSSVEERLKLWHIQLLLQRQHETPLPGLGYKRFPDHPHPNLQPEDCGGPALTDSALVYF